MASFMDKAKNFVTEKVADMRKPEASVTDVDLADVSRDGVTYKAKIEVDNPYSHSIPICQITYTLKSANKVIASGTMPDPGSIMGSQKTMLDVPLKVAHNVLVTLVKDISKDWDIDYELDIGLTIDLPLIGEFTIPLNSKGEIKLPSLSDLWK